MTQRRLMTVLLKGLGVWCVIIGTLHVTQTLSIAVGTGGLGEGNAWTVLLQPFPSILFLAIATYILIWHSESIAARLFPDDCPFPEATGRISDEWYFLALAVMGIVLMIWDVPLTLSSIVMSFALGHYGEGPGNDWRIYMRKSGWALVVRCLIQLVIGMYLIFGSRGLVAIIRRMRGQTEEGGR